MELAPILPIQPVFDVAGNEAATIPRTSINDFSLEDWISFDTQTSDFDPEPALRAEGMQMDEPMDRLDWIAACMLDFPGQWDR
ncbi:hypothetical protein W97_07743 [Coniosporium apollinis CBS 100218]|uniref:Uncharacterized protein n=1 Tax=Coniosporium apollinis (strain CBS 100218) TaxID=1168221 RepID=R7Z310_CONA1|nr:uncharacterized protein W97_07743 [Coniosporium apollinis CBS 100218]EON68419.1 hypothetical protein W97_07743 [Coniosporium apollinis CBS 100218]